MKIMVITRNLPPLVGGMEKLNWHMIDELNKYAEVIVIGPQGGEKYFTQKIKYVSVPLKPVLKFLFFATIKAIKAAIASKPDIILAGSGLTAPCTLLAAMLSKAKSVAYVHGLDITVQSSLYKLFWHPTIKRMDKVIANSSPTAKSAEGIGVNKTKIEIIHPGVTIPNVRPTQEEINHFRNRYSLGDRPLLLSVGRLAERKGIKEFVKKSLPQIVEHIPNALLLVIGATPKNSLYARAQTPQSIRVEAKKMGIENNVTFIGTVDEHSLTTAYCASSVHVFPVKEIANDPEGFGMVAIEAAAYGLPTVAFSTGGIVDAVKNNISGFLIPNNDYQLFSQKAIYFLSDHSGSNKSCQQHAKEFSWPLFGKKILTILSHWD